MVVAFKGLPADVTGLAGLRAVGHSCGRFVDASRFGPPTRTACGGAARSRHGCSGDNLEPLLARVRVPREALVDLGLEFARRRTTAAAITSSSITGDRDVDGWMPLNDRAPAAVVFDPMTGRRGLPRSPPLEPRALEVELAIRRAGSLIVATTTKPAVDRFPTFEPRDLPSTVPGPWNVRFVAGGPDLPARSAIARLASWTTFGGDDVKRFSGTAIYRTTFAAPARCRRGLALDLGRVHDSARVELERPRPGHVDRPGVSTDARSVELAAANVLAIHVSNLMANRIAAIDKAGVRWRKFYNVNFPARLPANRGPDGLFSAAEWEPLDSGLLGPVTLTPLTSPK